MGRVGGLRRLITGGRGYGLYATSVALCALHGLQDGGGAHISRSEGMGSVQLTQCVCNLHNVCAWEYSGPCSLQ